MQKNNIIYEGIQEDSDEKNPKYGSHDKEKREKANLILMAKAF